MPDDGERIGFRTMVQPMALARTTNAESFTDLDEQVRSILASMKPNALPSIQAALRTAIVLGDVCRVPALRLWLESRRRGSSERVRTPSISFRELELLASLNPSVEGLLTERTERKSGELRFANEMTVSVALRAIEEVVELASERKEARLLDGLSRLFACRSEDWIVPFGYAAARSINGPVPTAISRRVRQYAGEEDVPSEMIGAMRLADEAADLEGFVSLVLDELDESSGRDDLTFLADRHRAWSQAIGEIVRAVHADDQLSDSHVPALDDPPSPGPIVDPDDPQKGRWGGESQRNGRSVRAVLESVERGVFYFSVIVESTDGTDLQGPVVFHMHETYPRSIVTIRHITDRRQAVLKDWSAYGVFAIGVQVKDSSGLWISLELDLARLSGLPGRFLSR